MPKFGGTSETPALVPAFGGDDDTKMYPPSHPRVFSKIHPKKHNPAA